MEKQELKSPAWTELRRMFLSSVLWGSLLLLLPAYVSAQNTLKLKVRTVSFEELFLEIQQQTNLSFVYNADQMQKLGTVTVKTPTIELKALLDEILAGTPMTYSIEGNTIVIRPRDKKEIPAVQSKSIVVQGKVTDQKGHPLIGATVKVKDTAIGTATDENGYYRLNVPAGTVELEVSYIGYLTRTLPLQNRTEVNFTLEENRQEMDRLTQEFYRDMHILDSYGKEVAYQNQIPDYTPAEK